MGKGAAIAVSCHPAHMHDGLTGWRSLKSKDSLRAIIQSVGSSVVTCFSNLEP